MEGNIIYHLKGGHQAIDAVVKVRGSDDVVYLILIQISLSLYSKHESKYSDIYKTLKEPQNTKSVLDYYSSVSGIAKEKPKQLLKQEEKVDSVITISSCPTTRSGKTRTSHLVGLLEDVYPISNALLSLEKSLSGD